MAAVGETLASLNVSGSALRATIPVASVAAAMSATLRVGGSSSSLSFMIVFRDIGVVAEVAIVSASECFLPLAATAAASTSTSTSTSASSSA